MNKYLIRLFILATLLCTYLGFGIGVKEHRVPDFSKQGSEEQIRQSEGWLRLVAEVPLSPVGVGIRPTSSSNRIASSRHYRLLPTYGAPPNNHTQRWVKGNSSNQPLSPLLLHGRCRLGAEYEFGHGYGPVHPCYMDDHDLHERIYY